MKTLSSNAQAGKHQTNLLKEKISLLGEKGFLWREIAELTGLPKKLIKGLAKGEYIPNDEECARLCKVIDETTTRLRDSIEENNQNPEQDLYAQDHVCYKLGVKSVTLYKGTDDDKMIIQIHGVRLHD